MTKGTKEVRGEEMVMNLFSNLRKLEETRNIWGSMALLKIMQNHIEGAMWPKLCFLQLNHLF